MCNKALPLFKNKRYNVSDEFFAPSFTPPICLQKIRFYNKDAIV